MKNSKKVVEALKASVNPPFTVNYPFVPSPPPETFRGKPEFDDEQCVGCGICVERCPSEAIEVEDLGKERKLTVHYDVCIYCANCNYMCMPLEGIKPTHTSGVVFKDKSHAVFSITKPTVVVSVDEDLCIGCARCEYLCKFDAAKVTKKEDKWISTIDPIKCTGCGICSSNCPAIVIDVPLSPKNDILNVIREKRDFSHSVEKIPDILILHCNWANMDPEDLIQRVDSVNLKFVNITCSGRLHPLFILEAFKNGYDGVMFFGCPEEECHFEGGGPQYAIELSKYLKFILKEVGLDPERFELIFGSNVEPQRYHDGLVTLKEKLGKMTIQK